MKRLLFLALMIWPVAASAQQTTFTVACVGTAATDTAKFEAIKTIVGATNPATIRLPYKLNTARRCKVNNLTITANITLDNSDGSGVFVVTGQTFTVVGPVISPPRQMFYNATAGLGTVSFAGNTSVAEIHPEWWGMTPDALVALDGAISSGTDDLSSASSNFPTTIVGKSISVIGAGAGGATLTTTVLARPSSTSLTLAANASTTVTNARTVHGTSSGPLMTTVLTAAGTAKRAVVRPQRGLYFFPTATIDIPQSVTVLGSFDTRSIHRGGGCGLTDPEYNPIEADATTFLITANEGTATGYFMRLATNAAVKGVFTYYPAQIPSLATPKIYPWNFELRGTSSHLENVEIGLAYQGVKVVGGIQQVVRNVAGQPLSLGLYVTQVLDSPLFEHVHFETFHDFLSDDPLNPAHGCAGSAVPLVVWQQANGTAFRFGRVDNGQAFDLVAFGYLQGIHLVTDAADGDGPGGDPWVNFVGGDLEAAKPLVVDNTAGTPDSTTNGCSFVNYAFGPNLTADNGVVVNATFTGALKISSSNINGNVTNGLYYKAGATGWLGFTNNEIQQWSSAAIRLEGPAAVTIGHASIIGNRFKGTTVPTVDISGRMIGTMVSNIFAATLANGFASTSPLAFVYGPDVYADGAVGSAGHFNIGASVQAGSSLWSTNYKRLGIGPEGSFQFAAGNSSATDGNHVLTGAIFDGTNWRYGLTGVAPSGYSMFGGMHLFRVAPAGTAGDVIPWVTGLKVNTVGIASVSPGAAVASAAAIVPTGNIFHVTGTVTITSITATGITAGTRLTIIFDDVLTITDGSNLKLAGNFVTSADDSIELVFDGVNFYETSRSVN